MRGETCSPAWRMSALLLGTSWVMTLAVACGGGAGGGGDDVIATSVATGVAGSGARTEAGAMGVAALPAPTPAQMRAPLLRPCSDESRRPAQAAAVPAHLRAPPVHGNGLDDEALNLPAGRQGAGAADADPLADPFETK